MLMYMYIPMANDSAKREKQMMQERGGSLAGGGRGRISGQALSDMNIATPAFFLSQFA